MLPRTARWFAAAMVAFLLAEPIPFAAFAQNTSDQPCCCKGKNASCCRRSHHHASAPMESGPAFSSRECCGQCQIAVHKSQPVAETVPPATACALVAPAIPAPLTCEGWIPYAHHNAALFERPPPFTV